ncbi:MAG TPA: hypothetical protein VF147_15920 [Vicinamibacterales bacterium]
MSSSTGIELGPDSCMLAGVRARRRGPEIFAVHAIDASGWPSQDEALAGLLRSARRVKKLPRAARVVAWGLPEGARADDPVTRAQLRPVVAAGFQIDAVLSPPQALARLAAERARPGDNAVAWLALNKSGAAIAIVRGAELLFSRAFEWSFRSDGSGPRSELLHRYSLVAHLAPELQRGIAAVKTSHGIAVDAAVTCGDLPDLRSLTMPLIEELDLEVETLDSADGLLATGRARTERFAELAPAIRLACAAATTPSQRRGAGPLVAMAAAAVLIAVLGWAGYAYWAVPRMVAPSPAAPRAAPTVRPAPVGSTPPVAAPPVAAPPAVVTQPRTEPTPEKKTSPQQVPKASADTARGPRAKAPESRPAPLREPLPVIELTLVDQSRRIAMIGGVAVSVGATVGSRVVVQIEPEFVVFREPSGALVRVGIRVK